MFARKLGIVLAITFVISLCVGAMFDRIYKERWSTLFFDKTNVLVEDNSYYDIIYIGNSRVHFSINPYYVDSVTGLRSYNFGIGGADAEEMMLTGSLYLQKHPPPRIVVLALDRGAFGKNTNIKSRFHYLYYLGEDSIYKHVRHSLPAAAIIKIFPFTKYGFFDEYNRTSLFVKGNPIPVFDHNIYNGFVNVHERENKSVTAVFNDRLQDSFVFTKQSEVYLRDLITNFIHVGTKVVIISSPERSISTSNSYLLHQWRDSLINKITTGLEIRNFHFRNSGLIEDKYFIDEKHLNAPGATVYSLQLADSLKTIL